MLKQELEERLGYEITNEGYDTLNKMYMGCDLDKDEFVKVINAKQFKATKPITDIYTPDRYSKGGYEYTRNYKWFGYGCDVQFIYAIYETKYNIAKGLVYVDKFVGYCTRDKKEYIGYIR